MTGPPSVAFPGPAEMAAVIVPLKLVARFPNGSSASTSKPNPAPAVKLGGRLADQIQSAWPRAESR